MRSGFLFQRPDVLPEKEQVMVLPADAGGDLGGVALGHLLHGQVGGDDGVPPSHETGIDELIQGGLGELGGQLAAQVVQDEQVAVK